jgi:integrase
MSAQIPRLVWRNGVAYATWFEANKNRTIRVSLHTKDHDEAKTLFAGFLLDGADILAGTGRNARITVGQALDDYYREHVDLKCADKVRQKNAIVHLKEFFGNADLRSIDIPLSRAYAAARRAGTIGGGSRRPDKVGSDSTIRRELTVLKAAAHHALRWKRTTSADMPQMEMPVEDPGEAVWYTRDELAALMGAAEGDLLKFIRIAYYTAARRHSIEALTAEQVDLEQKRMNLALPGERRTAKRRPKVPIFAEIAGDVAELVERAPRGPLFGPGKVFYRPYRALCEDMGLPEKANPHILRHSRATHLLQDGVSLWAVAKLLGDTVATVERVYGHHCPDFLAATLGKEIAA